MPSSTNPQQAANDRAVVDAALEALATAEADKLKIEPLSDLSRSAAARLRERWHELDKERRARAVQAMTLDAERQIQRSYERALLVAFDDEDVNIRRAALDGLWEIESEDFLGELLTLVEREPDDGLRAAEADQLGHYAVLAELGQLDEALAERLRDVLLGVWNNDSSVAVRRAALESVAFMSDDEEISAAISAAYNSGERDLRVTALRAMGHQVDRRWLPQIGAELANHDPELRFEAARAAGATGDQRLAPALVDLVDDEDLEVQLAAIAGLGAIGGKLATNTLRRLTHVDRPAIVEAAEDALDEASLGNIASSLLP